MFMNKTPKKQPMLSEIIFQMIKKHPKTAHFCNDLTGINVSKVSELMNFPQPSLKKILDNKTRSMRFETEELFKTFFSVNSMQIRGEQTIPWLSNEAARIVIENNIQTEAANAEDDEKTAELKQLTKGMNINDIETLIKIAQELKNSRR